MLAAALALALAQCGCDAGMPRVIEASAAVIAPDVYASHWLEGTVVTPGTQGYGIDVVGMRAPSDTGSSADVTLKSFNIRDSGLKLVGFANASVLKAQVTTDGTFVGTQGYGSSGPPSFIDGSGGSGHVSLTAGGGLYPYVEGQLPSGYNGRHGAVTIGNKLPMTAGYVFEANNGTDGTTAKVFMISHQGGIVNLSGLSLAQFERCPGEADDGQLQWAVDKHRFYACTPNGWRGLSWSPAQ